MVGERGRVVRKKCPSNEWNKMAQPDHKGRKVRDINQFRKLDQREHVLLRPAVYLGSDQRIERNELLLDVLRMTMYHKTIELPECLEGIFKEILANAGDNTQRSRAAGWPVGEIEVDIGYNSDHPNRIRVRNGGVPFPCTQNDDSKEVGMFLPEFTFGFLLSGTNFDAENPDGDVSGQNGLGSKLANILSIFFRYLIHDPHHKKTISQNFYDNMARRDPAVIEPYHGEESLVEIEFEPDLKRFGYKEFPEETYPLFARYCADISLSSKVPVIFNGHRIEVTNIYSAANLYFGLNSLATPPKSFVGYHWKAGQKHKTVQTELGPIEEGTDYPILEYMFIDTINPNQTQAPIQSFVNGLATREHGTHVDVLYNMMLEHLNGEKGELKVPQLKRHLGLLVLCRWKDPKYATGNTKAKFNVTKKNFITPTITEKQFKPLLEWQFMSYVNEDLELAKNRLLEKTDGRKKRSTGLEKLNDANFAGHPDAKKSTQTILMLVEGDSAANLICAALGGKARDIYGFFPLRGKPLNLLKASKEQIANNEEYKAIKIALGLREGVDYTIKENYETLRYGALGIATDPDTDGGHIECETELIFFCQFYSLLQRPNFLRVWSVPAVISPGPGERLRWSTQREFDLWKNLHPIDVKKREFQYNKGLGTLSNKDIQLDYPFCKWREPMLDADAPRVFKLIFSKNNADERKQWMLAERPDDAVMELVQVPLSKRVNTLMWHHSHANIQRMIPAFTDGLKPVQRKIFAAALKRWKWGKDITEMKVLAFIGNVLENMGYEKGDTSLGDAITHMVPNWPGSNNLPILEELGQFSKRSGAKAAAYRYIRTRLRPYVKYLVRAEDEGLVKRETDNYGEELEPEFILTVVPLHLINPVVAVGTGWSCFVPPHELSELIRYIRSKLLGKRPNNLRPGFTGFKGTVEFAKKKEVKQRKKEEVQPREVLAVSPKASPKKVSPKKVIEDQPEEEGANDANNPLGEDVIGEAEDTNYLKVSGLWSVNEKGNIEVTELPINPRKHRTIDGYKLQLDQWRETKRIADYENYSTDNEPHFVIKGFLNPSLEALRLVTYISIDNMWLLDEHKIPQHYTNTRELIDKWIEWRLTYYGLRKEKLLKDYKERMELFSDKVKLVKLIVEKKLVIVDRTKKEIEPELKRAGLTWALFSSMSLPTITKEKIKELEDEAIKVKEEYEEFERIAPHQLWLNDLDELEKNV